MLQNKEGLTSPLFPVAVSMAFAYLTVDCFLAVFEMTVDTIFICFCEDREQNDGNSRPYFMSVRMMEVMQELKQAAGGEFNFGGGQNVDPSANPMLNLDPSAKPMLPPNAINVTNQYYQPPALPPSYGFTA